MTPFEAAVYRKVCTLYRTTQGPVRTVIVADMLGKHDRYIRYFLVRLEQKNIIERVGQRGGWLPARRTAALTNLVA